MLTGVEDWDEISLTAEIAVKSPVLRKLGLRVLYAGIITSRIL